VLGSGAPDRVVTAQKLRVETKGSERSLAAGALEPWVVPDQ
jgi:hypothetical protein